MEAGLSTSKSKFILWNIEREGKREREKEKLHAGNVSDNYAGIDVKWAGALLNGCTFFDFISTFSRPWPLGKMKRGDTPLIKQQSSPCLGKSEPLYFLSLSHSLITLYMSTGSMCNVHVLLEHSFKYSFFKEPICPITAGTCQGKNTKDKMRMAEYSTLWLEMGLLSGGVMVSGASCGIYSGRGK